MRSWIIPYFGFLTKARFSYLLSDTGYLRISSWLRTLTWSQKSLRMTHSIPSTSGWSIGTPPKLSTPAQLVPYLLCFTYTSSTLFSERQSLHSITRASPMTLSKIRGWLMKRLICTKTVWMKTTRTGLSKKKLIAWNMASGRCSKIQGRLLRMEKLKILRSSIFKGCILMTFWEIRPTIRLSNTFQLIYQIDKTTLLMGMIKKAMTVPKVTWSELSWI